jgi:hypothetical protein
MSLTNWLWLPLDRLLLCGGVADLQLQQHQIQRWSIVDSQTSTHKICVINRSRKLQTKKFKDKNMTELWQIYDKDMTEILLEYEKCMTRIWQQYDRRMTNIWQEYDRFMTELWQIYDKNMTELWQEYDKLWQEYDLHMKHAYCHAMMQVLVVQHGVVPAVGILECLVVPLVAPRCSKKLLLQQHQVQRWSQINALSSTYKIWQCNQQTKKNSDQENQR